MKSLRKVLDDVKEISWDYPCEVTKIESLTRSCKLGILSVHSLLKTEIVQVGVFVEFIYIFVSKEANWTVSQAEKSQLIPHAVSYMAVQLQTKSFLWFIKSCFQLLMLLSCRHKLAGINRKLPTDSKPEL